MVVFPWAVWGQPQKRRRVESFFFRFYSLFFIEEQTGSEGVSFLRVRLSLRRNDSRKWSRNSAKNSPEENFCFLRRPWSSRESRIALQDVIFDPFFLRKKRRKTQSRKKGKKERKTRDFFFFLRQTIKDNLSEFHFRPSKGVLSKKQI